MNTLLDFLTRWVGTMAKKTIAREQPLVIAITGSVGKSSTKQLIGAMLRASQDKTVRVTQKNYNNQLGVPCTVFDCAAPGRSPSLWLSLVWRAFLYGYGFSRTGVRTFVLEMGADHPGDLAYLTDIAPPSLSVVTAVTPESSDWAPVHAAHYPSTAAVAHEKATLVRRVSKTGIIILNSDDPFVIPMRHETEAHLLTFGTTEAADVHILATHVRLEKTPTGDLPTGLEVRLSIGHKIHTAFLPGVYGRSLAFSLAAAACVGLALDLTAEEIMTACMEEYRPLPGRVRLIPGIKGTMLLDDSYNASPASVLSSIRDLSLMPIDQARQRKIVCLGEMRELGPDAESIHERIGIEAAHFGFDLLAVTGMYAEAYARGAKLAGMPEERIQVFEDTPELGLWVQKNLHPGDLVLAKASEGTITTKGVRMERVIKELMAEPVRAGELLCRQGGAWGVRR